MHVLSHQMCKCKRGKVLLIYSWQSKTAVKVTFIQVIFVLVTSVHVTLVLPKKKHLHIWQIFTKSWSKGFIWTTIFGPKLFWTETFWAKRFQNKKKHFPVSWKNKNKQVGPTPESNSILKCILSSNSFWVQKIVDLSDLTNPNLTWPVKNWFDLSWLVLT